MSQRNDYGNCAGSWEAYNSAARPADEAIPMEASFGTRDLRCTTPIWLRRFMPPGLNPNLQPTLNGPRCMVSL